MSEQCDDSSYYYEEILHHVSSIIAAGEMSVKSVRLYDSLGKFHHRRPCEANVQTKLDAYYHLQQLRYTNVIFEHIFINFIIHRTYSNCSYGEGTINPSFLPFPRQRVCT